jgi:hypothetical protein
VARSVDYRRRIGRTIVVEGVAAERLRDTNVR